MQYRSSFIGIPLPERYLEEFIALTGAIKEFIPDIQIVDLTTPHITVFFLGDQNKKDLQKLAKEIEQQKATLEGEIIVGKGGHFGGSKPRVLYLEVKSESLKKFYLENFREFCKYREPEIREFKFHLTIGRMKGKASAEYKSNKQRVQALLNKKWLFPIREIAVYGIDIEQSAQSQEILFKIII
jgi:2'-5' RNA ligase